MNTNTKERTLKKIKRAITKKNTAQLSYCDRKLKLSGKEAILLQLTPPEYEKYHVLLRKTDIKGEVQGRN